MKAPMTEGGGARAGMSCGAARVGIGRARVRMSPRGQ